MECHLVKESKSSRPPKNVRCDAIPDNDPAAQPQPQPQPQPQQQHRRTGQCPVGGLVSTPACFDRAARRIAAVTTARRSMRMLVNLVSDVPALAEGVRSHTIPGRPRFLFFFPSVIRIRFGGTGAPIHVLMHPCPSWNEQSAEWTVTPAAADKRGGRPAGHSWWATDARSEPTGVN